MSVTTVFRTAGAIVAGAGSFRQIVDYLPAHEWVHRRVLIVTSPSIVRQGLAASLQRQLGSAGIASELVDDIRPEPTADSLESLSVRIEREPFDAFIGLGGGSVLDATKLLAVRHTNERPIESMLGIECIERDGIPTVLIPTTSGTGSETTPNAIVTLPERQLKIAVVSRRLYPRLALLDPELTIALPRAVTAATGMDAFTHALESLIGNKANPISDMFALEAIRLISGSIAEACENGGSLSARQAMLYGSAYGGMALAASGTAAVHALAYPLGGRFGVPHGTANAMLLPHVMEAQLDAVRGRLIVAADAMRRGTANAADRAPDRPDAAEWAVGQIEQWTREIGIPQNLSDFGVTGEDIPQLAEAASRVTRLLDNNPKRFAVHELERIYRKLLPR